MTQKPPCLRKIQCQLCGGNIQARGLNSHYQRKHLNDPLLSTKIEIAECNDLIDELYINIAAISERTKKICANATEDLRKEKLFLDFQTRLKKLAIYNLTQDYSNDI